ncbi:MAG: hypothetical protein IJB59_02750 [Oscillospiraceae bacterium]|nr:hypothetical protein [Oscillospiraceae bacterium]
MIYGAVMTKGMPEMMHSRIFRKEEWRNGMFVFFGLSAKLCAVPLTPGGKKGKM